MVERRLPKPVFAGSIPVSRSIKESAFVYRTKALSYCYNGRRMVYLVR